MREVQQRLIPSINIGEYRPGIERPDDGGLYPLEEAGTYGPVPKSKHPGKWSQPKAYVPREKKPKIYASYAICEGCTQNVQESNKTGTRRRGSVSTVVSDNLTPPKRAVSEPPKSPVKKQVKFEPRSMSEPIKSEISNVEEELGMVGRLKLAMEVMEDTIGSLKV